MTVSPPELTEPEPAQAYAASSPPPRRGPRLVRIAPIVALVGLALAAAGFVVGLRPLRTPVQDCGTAFGFLLDGRVEEFGDPANPPAGLTRAEVEEANANPCQERAAHRALPGLVLLLAGGAISLGAVLAEVAWRFVHRRRAVPAAPAAATDEPLAAPPPSNA